MGQILSEHFKQFSLSFFRPFYHLPTPGDCFEDTSVANETATTTKNQTFPTNIVVG